jgi:hypothetical protein
MHKKTVHLLAMLFGAWPFLLAQQPVVDSFPEGKAREIITVLAGDSLRGRGNFTPDVLKAAGYIMKQFEETGLSPLQAGNYFYAFKLRGGSSKQKKDKLQWNGTELKSDAFLYFHDQPGSYQSRDLSAFKVIKADSFNADILKRYQHIKGDVLLWCDEALPGKEMDIAAFSGELLSGARLLVSSAVPPQSILLEPVDAYYRAVGYNIVGVLPGKRSPSEYIFFSAHYDHLGAGKRPGSIMNGANDNASGTTALLMLARYFAMKNDNDRTIVFCAFAGEELGLKGSSAMVKEMKVENIKAGINLEMLGLPQYGPKTLYITGEKYSWLPVFLRRTLTEEGINVIPEPKEEKRLFARSDNFPFFRKGVPFHTIMASDDDEPCYHRPCDDTERMDIPNLCFITRAIANASRDLIAGLRIMQPLIMPDYSE